MYTAFQFTVVHKMAFSECFLLGGQKDGSQKYYIRTVGRMRKNSPLHCCNCVPCTQSGVQSGSVMSH